MVQKNFDRTMQELKSEHRRRSTKHQLHEEIKSRRSDSNEKSQTPKKSRWMRMPSMRGMSK